MKFLTFVTTVVIALSLASVPAVMAGFITDDINFRSKTYQGVKAAVQGTDFSAADSISRTKKGLYLDSELFDEVSWGYDITDYGFDPSLHEIDSATLYFTFADDKDSICGRSRCKGDKKDSVKEQADITLDGLVLAAALEINSGLASFELLADGLAKLDDGVFGLVSVQALDISLLKFSDFYLQSASLEVNYSLRPSGPTNFGGLPEPGSLALVVLGLLGLGFIKQCKTAYQG
ncbi:hypothetical protein A9Q89_01170 [Gammaproteobacteria bacterium 53_120_T64]|nr:hypothetical protein A9Q89_01170 [Gammaproteobacteria bacterium 53_120_T64]